VVTQTLMVAGASALIFLALRRWTALRYVAASLPCWAIANEQPWAMTAALGLTFAALYQFGLAPLLPTRRRRTEGPPLWQLAAGPRAMPEARTYPGGTPSRALTRVAWGMGALAALLVALAGTSEEPEVPVGLALASTIIGGTFAFGNWFATRMHTRIDARGLHARVLLAEHTVPWADVRELSLRHVFPGAGVRMVCFCVRSSTREIAFPSSMSGAAELRAAIERAVGARWPDPEVTSAL
jgi:Bacterial PH domain